MKEIAAAVIRRDGRLLLCRRAERPGDSCAGLWEFPGGKREPGESLEDCLVRECREELGVQVKPLRVREQLTHIYPEITVRLTFFDAELTGGEPEARVHTALVWALPEEWDRYPVCPADRPLLERLREEETP
mgnify:FL=1